MNLKESTILKIGNHIKTDVFHKRINIIFIVILFFGIILGSFSVGFFSTDVLEKINDIFIKNFIDKTSGFNLNVFLSSMFTLLFFAFFLIFSALSFFGPFIIFLILFLRGFSIGILLGCIYVTYLFKGILFCTFVLSPGLFISSMALITLSIKSLFFSLKFSRKIFPNANNTENLWPCFLNYIKKLNFTIFIFVISAIVDLLLIGISHNLFKF